MGCCNCEWRDSAQLRAAGRAVRGSGSFGCCLVQESLARSRACGQEAWLSAACRFEPLLSRGLPDRHSSAPPTPPALPASGSSDSFCTATASTGLKHCRTDLQLLDPSG
ncbi:hypothetical protein NDU88_003852 [Pleurodeles waltl]|uniref:Uncharacterized protein n=1 Tax=Pleurodeles waltl TaxID=8319 RepID=A0AAV7LMR1_PLEWA|nr:hypothetical protein NDU88_003852 [Pleurodeles waltl]